MNKRVPGLFFLMLCVAIGLVVFYAMRPAAEATPTQAQPAATPDEFALRQLRDAQRAHAAAEVKRLVAEAHPEAAGADSSELKQARDNRLDEMAAAVRRALATPAPTQMPTAENHATP
jgi:uncharacterized protein with beta-barrel porin domain